MNVAKFLSFIPRMGFLFWVTVFFPTVTSAVYFGLFASDIYTSESQFVVRSPQRSSASSGLGMLLQGGGFSKAQDDSYSVHQYSISRDALATLVQELGVDKTYSDKKIDIFSRFAGIDPDNSFEALHRYYQKMVSVKTDSASSISTLSVKAFSANEAWAANSLLLKQSEELVNRLNDRGRKDMITYAKAEVEIAAEKAKQAALALSTYRDQEGVLDPEREGAVLLQQVSKLQDELIATTTYLSQLQAFTPQNPQIPSLLNRIDTLRKEILKETGKAAGGKKSLAGKAASFQRLALDAELTSKQLASAIASLETARNEAQRQQVYLERIAQPSLPDVAQEPRRLRSVLATFFMGLVAWGILSMLVAGVREHQE